MVPIENKQLTMIALKLTCTHFLGCAPNKNTKSTHNLQCYPAVKLTLSKGDFEDNHKKATPVEEALELSFFTYYYNKI